MNTPHLIESAARGDAQALEQLLMKAQDTAYRFSHTVCGGPSDADDVMQDALLKTFRYVKRIHGCFSTSHSRVEGAPDHDLG